MKLCDFAVSLFMRLWVEIHWLRQKRIVLERSASLWGCELKCGLWWYCKEPRMSASLWGCELKFENTGCSGAWRLSASLWGCELKCSTKRREPGQYSQPLYEAVSWNLCRGKCRADRFVSLFMRLWVEITDDEIEYRISPSASLWGCELKYDIIWTMAKTADSQPLYEAVSWNTQKELESRESMRSASLWGCELKCDVRCRLHSWGRQPLYEAVSWNIPQGMIGEQKKCQPLYEAVSWNIGLVSQYGVIQRQPLYEAVSWNFNIRKGRILWFPSASLWGCELK